MDAPRISVLSAEALDWGYRLLWALCIAVYMTVFVSGIVGGGSELTSMGRAVGFALAAALTGKLALSVVAQATQQKEEPLSATADGTVGSRIDMVSSPIVSEPEDEAEAA